MAAIFTGIRATFGALVRSGGSRATSQALVRTGSTGAAGVGGRAASTVGTEAAEQGSKGFFNTGFKSTLAWTLGGSALAGLFMGDFTNPSESSGSSGLMGSMLSSTA
jgi:hypothetical protein